LVQRPGRRFTWRSASLTDQHEETSSARTLVLAVSGWPGHLAGQHVDLRLTADDGYQAVRSYSLAAPAQGDRIAVTVQRVPCGEVSPYLTEVFAIGDAVEVRGPLGGWFVWRPTDPEPVLLVAGGSGIVPLMAMVRARRSARSHVPFRLLYSVRTAADLYYAAELRAPQPGLEVTCAFTRAVPEGVARPPGRLDAADIERGGWPPGLEPRCFVCGPTGFVESVADILVALGHDPRRIKTERFGPTGG
jgi:ferredoxin-NADP reductase